MCRIENLSTVPHMSNMIVEKSDIQASKQSILRGACFETTETTENMSAHYPSPSGLVGSPSRCSKGLATAASAVTDRRVVREAARFPRLSGWPEGGQRRDPAVEIVTRNWAVWQGRSKRSFLVGGVHRQKKPVNRLHLRRGGWHHHRVWSALDPDGSIGDNGAFLSVLPV